MRVARLLIFAAVALVVASLGGALPPGMPGTGALAILAAVLALAAKGAATLQTHGTAPLISTLRRRSFEITLGIIAAAALGVRMPGIGHGPGHVPTDIDENRLALSVMHFFRTGSIEHDTVEHYPGIHFWLLAASFLVTYVWGLMTETMRSFADLPSDPFVVAGRVLNAGLDCATVVLTALMGRIVAGRAAGLWAAVLVAFAPLAIVTSTQLRNEAALVVTSVAAVYAALVALSSESRRPLWIAGALAGLAAAIKYSGVFALLPALLAAIWSASPVHERVRRTAIVTASFVAALAVTNHFLWADFPNFIHQLSTEVGMTGAGHWAAMANPRAFYPVTLAGSAFGWPLVIVAAVYTVFAIARGGKRGILLVVFPLTYFWFMSSRPSQFPRWVYTLTPFVACAAMAGVWAIGAAITRVLAGGSSERSFLARAVPHGLVVASLVPMIPMSATEISRRPTTPPYALAEAWLASKAAAGDRVLSEDGWLDLKGTGVKVHRTPSLKRSLDASDLELNTFQWIVVPEVYFGDPNVKRLQLAQAFNADFRFGGNAGIDIHVYTPPPLAAVDAPDVVLGSPASSAFLGLGWSDDRSEASGAGLSSEGGYLFLPLAGQTNVRFELELVTSGRPGGGGAVPIDLTANDTPVALEVLSNGADGRMHLMSAAIPGASSRAQAIALSIRPKAGIGAVRVVRCRRVNGDVSARPPTHG